MPLLLFSTLTLLFQLRTSIILTFIFVPSPPLFFQFSCHHFHAPIFLNSSSNLHFLPFIFLLSFSYHLPLILFYVPASSDHHLSVTFLLSLYFCLHVPVLIFLPSSPRTCLPMSFFCNYLPHPNLPPLICLPPSVYLFESIILLSPSNLHFLALIFLYPLSNFYVLALILLLFSFCPFPSFTISHAAFCLLLPDFIFFFLTSCLHLPALIFIPDFIFFFFNILPSPSYPHLHILTSSSFFYNHVFIFLPSFFYNPTFVFLSPSS